jgi:hypothetical protein
MRISWILTFQMKSVLTPLKPQLPSLLSPCSPLLLCYLLHCHLPPLSLRCRVGYLPLLFLGVVSQLQPLMQVSLPQLLAVANGMTSFIPIDLLVPAPSFKTFLLITSPELVLYPLRIFNHNLKFGNFVLWAIFLAKTLVTEPYII